MLVHNSTAGTSHLGQTLDIIPYSATFSMWSAIHAVKIGKHLQTLPSVQSIGTPSCARSCRGAKMSVNTSRRVSALICLGVDLLWRTLIVLGNGE